jgi:cell division protein FtsI/penicillin-binding protein 2
VLGNWVTHGWFAGFAAFHDPRIAVVVFLERGEGSDAAQIAGQVVAAYFGEGYAGN